MADFTTLNFEANIGNVGTPSWTVITGANTELRWHNTSTVSLTTPSATWPSVTRPTSGTTGIDYAYAFTADAVGHGVFGGGSSQPPAAFATTQYLQYRWNWDNLGTFAGAPITTAYPTTSHGAITRGDASLLGGHTSDTGATARSYLKGTAFGRVGSAGVPAAGPGGALAVTTGTTGAVTPTAGANWSSWQSMQGDNDWLAFPSTPAATTADQWHVMLRLFTGVNMGVAVHVPVLSLKYTFS
jgi:hypothetical protein